MPDLDPASIGPRADIPRVSDDELRYLASSGAHISSEATRSVAAELLAARDRLADLEADRNVVVGQLRTSREIVEGCRLLIASGEQEIADLYARVAELERQLREEGNHAGRLGDQLRAACTEGADARARVAELEAESLLQVQYDVWLKCNRGIDEGDWAEFMESREDGEQQ